MFKRVRLGVRRRSNGQQIPWESTSLEEDFYFLPPKELKKLSERETQRLYEEESALWERIRASATPGPLEDYLRRYPSGNFSELAQSQLDRVLARQGEKKIHVESSAANPYSKGTGITNTDYKVGDSYSYRTIDVLTGVERARFTEEVVKLTDNEVIFDNGVITDYLGNLRTDRGGTQRSSHQSLVSEYAVGKRWESRSITTRRDGLRGTSELSCHVAAREPISLPAGTFDAFRIEVRGFVTFPGTIIQIDAKNWVAPDRLRRQIVGENLWRAGSRYVNTDRHELVAFKEG